MDNEVIIDYIELNERKLTFEQFEQEKKKLQEQKIQLVEVGTNKYKTRLLD